MISIARRDMLKWGVVTPVLAAGSHAVLASAPQGIDALVLDRRFPELANGAGLDGPELLHITGDVTGVWYDRLDAAWRGRGFVLAGVTGSDALFVLEQLAQHHGRRVVERRQLAQPDARGVAPFAWVIAPVHPSVTA